MNTHTAVYGRTGPACPLTAEAQVEHLNAVATQHGWTVTHEFTDRPRSVRRDHRPGESALISAISNRLLDRLLLLSLDRIGRTSADLVSFLEVCRVAEVSLWVDDQKLDTSTANGLSIFDVVEMLALHQRHSRREQILRGLSAARSLSIKLGRPSLSPAKIKKAKELIIAGKGIRESARLVGGISPASICRIKASMTPAAVTRLTT